VNVLAALHYAPIARALVVLLVAGCVFPLTGVFVLRLNLVTMRFALMHGTMLGAAVALAIGGDQVLLAAAVNIALVVLIALYRKRSGLSAGTLTTFLMVTTIGLAFVVIYRAGVPAKDTLSILWGNLFALRPVDAVLTGAFAAATLAFVVPLFGQLRALLFSQEVAFSAGIRAEALHRSVLVLVGLTVAFSVRLVGALLLDALLLLPAIVATFFARSTRQLFLFASAAGLVSSALGFLLSLWLDIPASSAVTVVAAAVLAVGFLSRRRIA
jgi:zinc transport system permease protein